MGNLPVNRAAIVSKFGCCCSHQSSAGLGPKKSSPENFFFLFSPDSVRCKESLALQFSIGSAEELLCPTVLVYHTVVKWLRCLWPFLLYHSPPVTDAPGALLVCFVLKVYFWDSTLYLR